MLKLRSSYLFNIYLIHVVWNHVDKKMLVFYENVYKIMRALISLHGYWWKRNTRWIHILILVGFMMFRFLLGLFYDNLTICKHWFYFEIILNYQTWSIDVKFCRLYEIVLVLMWFGVDFYRHKYWYRMIMWCTDIDFCRFDAKHWWVYLQWFL